MGRVVVRLLVLLRQSIKSKPCTDPNLTYIHTPQTAMRGAGAAVAPHNGRPQRRQQQQQQQHRSSSRWALPLALLRLRRLLPRRPPALRRLTSHRRGRRLLVLTIALTCALMVLLGGQRLLPALASADGNPSTSQLLSSLLARTSPLLSVQSAPPPPPPPPAPSPDFEPLANLTPLPAFTAAPLPKFNSNNVSGPTSYVLGATLTRDARLGQREDEETEALLVDVFFMGVSGMVGGTTFSGVEQDKGASPEWRAAAGTIVKDVRRMAVEDGYAFACRFRLAHAWGGDDGEEEQEEEASVPAIVVPVCMCMREGAVICDFQMRLSEC